MELVWVHLESMWIQNFAPMKFEIRTIVSFNKNNESTLKSAWSKDKNY